MKTIRWVQHLILCGIALLCISPAFADKAVKCKTSLECKTKGQNLVDGRGTKFDPDLGLVYLEAACAMNDATACFAAGAAYERFVEVTNAKEKKIIAYEKACILGLIEGCNNAVVHLTAIDDPAPSVLQRANKIYSEMCDREIALGCKNLAVSYTKGTGVEPDDAVANELLLKACDLGSCGFGTKPHFEPGAVRPLRVRRVAEMEAQCLQGGIPDSCEWAAASFGQGNGVELNPERGVDIMSRACTGGSAAVCWKLGQALMYGWLGFGKDAARSLSLLKTACESEHAYACGDIERLLSKNPELAENPDEAQSYARRACDLGDTYACEKIVAPAAVNGE